MWVKGALHVHSTLSHDGTLSIGELARFYRERRYQFIAMGEHSQDINTEKVRALVQQSAAVSDERFLVLPGIEYTCQDPRMHILGVGSVSVAEANEPVQVTRHIHEQGGFAVLAHPRRVQWEVADELLREVDGVEIWNLGYDGKYLPPVAAVAGFRRMREANRQLLAVASHDLHTEAAFYDLAVEMDIPLLARGPILKNLRQGLYRIRSPLFSTGPEFELSGAKAALLQICSRQLAYLRQARDQAVRWST